MAYEHNLYAKHTHNIILNLNDVMQKTREMNQVVTRESSK
jgi:hypothetical protein